MNITIYGHRKYNLRLLMQLIIDIDTNHLREVVCCYCK